MAGCIPPCTAAKKKQRVLAAAIAVGHTVRLAKIHGLPTFGKRGLRQSEKRRDERIDNNETGRRI
ncbi:MAG TPA: hypothetical protein PL081_07015, partial [Pseudomonadales bacterium]|nr:hypothetical protein [Pseudomonadales bacterium]